MNSLTQSKNTFILPILIAMTLACFALAPTARAVTPAPDGGYHRATSLGLTVCLLMRTSGWRGRFTSTVAHTVQHLMALRCSASTGNWPFNPGNRGG